MATKTYTKPSGTDIEVNDTPATQAYAEANGWTEKKAPRKKAAPKKKDK